jgi:5-oxoprolinase (ATP-hydrolysing)
VPLMGGLFHRYRCEFGFTIEGREIVVDDVRVRGVGKSLIHTDNPVPLAKGPPRVDKVSCWSYYTLRLPG